MYYFKVLFLVAYVFLMLSLQKLFSALVSNLQAETPLISRPESQKGLGCLGKDLSFRQDTLSFVPCMWRQEVCLSGGKGGNLSAPTSSRPTGLLVLVLMKCVSISKRWQDSSCACCCNVLLCCTWQVPANLAVHEGAATADFTKIYSTALVSSFVLLGP